MGVFIPMSITTRALIIFFSLIKTHSVMAFTLYNFTLYPGFEPAVIYNVTYKKID